MATATIATVFAAVLGVPLAYLLARRPGRVASTLGALVSLPLALPPLMGGILLLSVLGPYALLGRLTGGRLTDDLAGIVAAQLFVAAPFLVLAARSAFRALDPALEEIAATLGHGPWSRFRRVALRAAGPGVAAGLLLTWLRAFGEFGATVLLAYHPYSLPVLGFVAFSSSGLAATARPVLAALAVAAALPAGAALLARPLRRLRRAVPDTIGRAPPVAPLPAGVAGGSSPVLSLSVRARVGSFTVQVACDRPARHLVLLGASGAGKSTVLRAVAGVLTGAQATTGLTGPDGGDLCARSAEKRRIGYLPQDAGLLPGLAVWRQVRFGRGVSPGAAAHWLRRLDLLDLLDRLPGELSGGQRRRVGLARALAYAPALLLLDEPFAGLDAPVRARLRRLLRDLQQETAIPTVVVTHDLEDAAALGELVAVLDCGEVVQQGSLAELLQRPASPQVARLLGADNVLRDGERSWSVRPEQLWLTGPLSPGGWPATLLDSYPGPHGWENLVALEDGTRLLARGAPPPVALGQRCQVHTAGPDLAGAGS